MWLNEIFHRARSPRVDDNDDRTAVKDQARRVAIVIAGPELAAAVSELYQARGYEVFVPETRSDVIETLVAKSDQVRAVVISPEATWASGLRTMIARECPRLERIALLS